MKKLTPSMQALLVRLHDGYEIRVDFKTLVHPNPAHTSYRKPVGSMKLSDGKSLPVNFNTIFSLMIHRRLIKKTKVFYGGDETQPVTAWIMSLTDDGAKAADEIIAANWKKLAELGIMEG